jgi:hypothetical protein
LRRIQNSCFRGKTAYSRVADQGWFIRIRIFSIPDPGSKRFPNPDPHQRIEVFTPKKFLSSLKKDSQIPDPKLDFFLSIPDPGIQKAPDPASGIRVLNTVRYRFKKTIVSDSGSGNYLVSRLEQKVAAPDKQQ